MESTPITSLVPITSYRDLTDSFISENIPNELYMTTKGYRLYGDKQSFCEKIMDRYARYIMLKSCFVLEGNDFFNKIIHLVP